MAGNDLAVKKKPVSETSMTSILRLKHLRPLDQHRWNSTSEWVLSYKHKNSLDLLQFYQMPRTAKFNWIRWKFPLRVECVAYDTNRISIGLSIVPDNFVSTQSKIYRGLTGIIDSSATQIHLPPCMEISNAQTKYPLPPCKKILNSHPKFLLPSYK
jgi:hypothetical protein